MITDSARRIGAQPRTLDSLPLPILHHISGYLSLLEPRPTQPAERACDCGACFHSVIPTQEPRRPPISPGLIRFSLINKGLRNRVWPDMIKTLIVNGDDGAKKIMESLYHDGRGEWTTATALIKTVCVRIYLRDEESLPTPPHINALFSVLSPHLEKLQIDMVDCPYPADHLTNHPTLGWWGKDGSHSWKCGDVLPKPFVEGGDQWHRIKVELPCLTRGGSGDEGKAAVWEGTHEVKGGFKDGSKGSCSAGITWPNLAELTVRSIFEDERRLDEEYNGNLIGLATIIAGASKLERLRLTGQFLDCGEAIDILQRLDRGSDEQGVKLRYLELELRGGGKQSVRRELLWTALGTRSKRDQGAFGKEKGNGSEGILMKLPETSRLEVLVLELVPGLIKLRDQDWITLDRVLRRHTELTNLELPIGFSTVKSPNDAAGFLSKCLRSLVGEQISACLLCPGCAGTAAGRAVASGKASASTFAQPGNSTATDGTIDSDKDQWDPLTKLVKIDIKYGSRIRADELSHQGCQSTGLRVDCWKTEHQDNLFAVFNKDSDGNNSKVQMRFTQPGQGVAQKYCRYKSDGDIIPVGPDGGLRDSIWPRGSTMLDMIPRSIAEVSYSMGHVHI